jgi:hypothetical protein
MELGSLSSFSINSPHVEGGGCCYSEWDILHRIGPNLTVGHLTSQQPGPKNQGHSPAVVETKTDLSIVPNEHWGDSFPSPQHARGWESHEDLFISAVISSPIFRLALSTVLSTVTNIRVPVTDQNWKQSAELANQNPQLLIGQLDMKCRPCSQLMYWKLGPQCNVQRWDSGEVIGW